MSEHGLFFNSVNHDRVYNAESFSDWLKKFFTNGVFTGDLQVKADEGMTVSVGSGYVNINGKVMIYETSNTLTLEAANGIYPRIDTIVVELNHTDRDIFLKVVTGDYSNLSDPQPTAPVRTGTIYQLVLAQIYVGVGVTEITQADITDTRADSSLCGIVTGTVTEMDFTQFAAQFNSYYANFKSANEKDFNTWSAEQRAAFLSWMSQQRTDYENWSTEQKNAFESWMGVEKDDFDEWFANLHYILDGDVAGHLQNEIDEINDSGLSGSFITIRTSQRTLYGKMVTVAGTTQTKSATFDTSGVALIANFTDVGEITVTSTDGTRTASRTFTIPYYGKYMCECNFWTAPVNISTGSEELYNRPIYVYRDGTQVNEISFTNEGKAIYNAPQAGNYIFRCVYEGENFEDELSITEETTYTAEIDLWTATISITTMSTELYGKTIEITSPVMTGSRSTSFDDSGKATYKAHKAGTYTFAVEYEEE